MQKITPHLWFDKEAKGTAEQIARVTEAFLQMKKFNITALVWAYKGV